MVCVAGISSIPTALMPEAPATVVMMPPVSTCQIVQRDSRGNEIDGHHSAIELKMLSDTYRRFMTAGLPMPVTMLLSDRAATLRIVVRDAGSGMIGSLTVPLKAL